jgi:purine-binding chemotaxis protein CheW
MERERRNNRVGSEVDDDGEAGKYLTFMIGNESYGVSIRPVTEIIGIQEITPVPDMPSFVRGVINLRGKVIPIMDVRLRFQREPRAYDERTCIIVIELESSFVGLVVDTVSEVISIPDEAIDKPPRFSNSAGNRFMMGLAKVGEQVKILLDPTRLLFDGAETLRSPN